MSKQIPTHYKFSPEITNKQDLSRGVLALESAVITHGLPRPYNLEIAKEMEQIARDMGIIPATIAVLGGSIHIGLTSEELTYLANSDGTEKISKRDFEFSILKHKNGGTTVAGTLFAAHQVGIRVFATGGIGGVHEIITFDVSADLHTLSDTPLIVICSGGKSILDLHATMEYLETMSIPVIGYRTNELPSFYSQKSGIPLNIRLDTPEEIIEFAKIHWDLGLKSSILVCQPVPLSQEINKETMDKVIKEAKKEAQKNHIFGQALTPYLLSQISKLTDGKSLTANRSLLLSNARLGSEIAIRLPKITS